MKEKNVILQPAKKNRRKIIRSIIQLIVVLFLAVVLIKAVFLTDKRFAEAVPLNNKEGFIALSYFGVSRNDSPKYVSKKNLEEQLTLLEKQGYQTITQKDILIFIKRTNHYLKKHCSYHLRMDVRILVFSHKILWKN